VIYFAGQREESVVEPVDKAEEPRASDSATYEPPRIEKVLTAEDLAREVQYAGAPSIT
jgi:hypothetical protein